MACYDAGRCVCPPSIRHRVRFPWPPKLKGLKTPEFLQSVRGDFPPDAVIAEEIQERRKYRRSLEAGADPEALGASLPVIDGGVE